MNISITSLGGAGEIGMNMYIYETDRYAVIVDCGVKFTKSDEIGTDLIIPDFSYLQTILHKQIILILTHAHEDHIGGVPFLLKEYPNIMVISGRYSYAVLDSRLKEHGISIKYEYITDFMPFTWGDFEITMYPISHSIHGTYSILLNIANNIKVMHISDYKIDTAPVTCTPFPLKEFIEIGQKGIDCLFADSTNILHSGFTPGEHSIIQKLDEIFKNATGRIFFTTFASNTERLQTIFDCAEKYDKKVVIEGSSIKKHIDVAKKYNKIFFNEDVIISRKQAEKLNDNQICFIVTGSQGEASSTLCKISEKDYSNIKIKKNDTFIFSSRIIPGNENRIINIINNIYKQGGMVITQDDDLIHVSGHAAKEDAILLLNVLKPKYLIPIHGEIKHIIKHKQIAIDNGLNKDNIIFFLSGDKLIFNNNTFIEKQQISSSKKYVDMSSEEFLTIEDVKNRKKLAINGAIVVVNNAESIKENNIIIRLIGISIKEEYINILKESILEYYKSENSIINHKITFEEYTEQTVKKFFKKRFNKRPLISIINTSECGINIDNGALQ